jgi:vancomycin aglycone glucosyltransferase
MRAAVATMIANQFDAIAAAAESCDVIVAATALQVAARSVAEARRLGYVFVAYSPTVLPSPHHAPPPLTSRGETPPPGNADNRELWAKNAAGFNATFAEALNAERALRGLAPVTDVRQHMFTDRPWLAADPVLAPWPDPTDGEVFQPGAWIVQDDRPLSPELQAFLAAGPPPVYFGFGSMQMAPDLSDAAVKTARALGRRTIMLRGWAELSVVAEASDCLVIGEVNQQALFKRVAAVVHHGGAGTTTTAALAGAPQVIVPQLYDQHDWGRRIEALGIGAAHAPGAPSLASLTTALERALQPEVARRAQAIAPTLRTDGARIAAARLLAQPNSRR